MWLFIKNILVDDVESEAAGESQGSHEEQTADHHLFDGVRNHAALASFLIILLSLVFLDNLELSCNKNRNVVFYKTFHMISDLEIEAMRD